MNQAAGRDHRPSARFPRRVRLCHKADFERVRSLGQTWRHPLFVLIKYRNDQGFARFGIVVGKRVGNAVARNRARRLLREAARLVYSQLASGWDIVLIARPSICDVKAQRVHVVLVELARRAGLIQMQNGEIEG